MRKIIMKPICMKNQVLFFTLKDNLLELERILRLSVNNVYRIIICKGEFQSSPLKFLMNLKEEQVILCGNKMIHLLDDSCQEKLLKSVTLTIRLLYLISLKENIFKTMQIKICFVCYSPSLPKQVYVLYLLSRLGKILNANGSKLPYRNCFLLQVSSQASERHCWRNRKAH